jgi:hypothetical protein
MEIYNGNCLPATAGVVDTLNGTGPSLVILVAMIIIFSAAGYFTGRLYGKTCLIAVVAGFVAVVTGLYTACYTLRLINSSAYIRAWRLPRHAFF